MRDSARAELSTAYSIGLQIGLSGDEWADETIHQPMLRPPEERPRLEKGNLAIHWRCPGRSRSAGRQEHRVGGTLSRSSLEAAATEPVGGDGGQESQIVVVIAYVVPHVDTRS